MIYPTYVNALTSNHTHLHPSSGPASDLHTQLCTLNPSAHIMPPIPPTDELLSHLARCKECGYYVGAALMCKGQGDETKKGFWYEKVRPNHKHQMILSASR